jgi:hypothetical protein
VTRQAYAKGVVLLLVILACFHMAQAQESSRIPLRLDRAIPVSGLQGASMISPLKCDNGGNIYVRFDHPRVYAAPVVKITSDGEKKAIFSLAAAKDWDEGEFYDFAVPPDGSLYLLAARRGKGREIEHAILSFNEEGKYRLAIPLKVPITSLNQLTVFQSGEFLVIGSNKMKETASGQDGNQTQSGKPPEVEARILVLSRNGDIVREVSLTSDLEETSEGSSSKKQPLVLPVGAVSLGRSVAGDNGEIFLKFRASSTEVYAVLPRAETIKRVDIAPPSKESQALNMWFASGKGLVVQFAEKGPGRSFNTALSVISIVDPGTGERLYDYQVTADIGGVFACYAPKGFLFLWTDQEGRLNLRRAVPR